MSKHNNWITISTKTRNRNLPLEKIKTKSKDESSKIIPKWMEIKYKEKEKENFRVVPYYPIKQKAKGLTVLVDKNLNPPKNKYTLYNPEKSIFSFGDFRNNVVSEEERKFNDDKVSKLPKKFFDWDDGKKFNPKYKKDV